MVGKKKPKQNSTDKKENAKSLSYEASSRRTKFRCIKGPDLDLQPQYGYFTARNITLQEFSFRNRILRVHLHKCNFKDLTTPRGFRDSVSKKQSDRKSQGNSRKRVAETNSTKTFRSRDPQFRSPKIEKSPPRLKTVKKEKKQIPDVRKATTLRSVLDRKTLGKNRKQVRVLRDRRSRKLTPKGIQIVSRNRKPVSAVKTLKIRSNTRSASNGIETVKRGRKPGTLRNGSKVNPAPKDKKQVAEVRIRRNSGKGSLSLNGVKTTVIKKAKTENQIQTLPVNTQLNTKKLIVKVQKVQKQVVEHLDKNSNLQKNISDNLQPQPSLEPPKRKRGRPRKNAMPIVQNNSESTVDANLNRLKVKSQVFKEEPRLNYKFQKLVSDVKTMKLPTLEWKIKVIIRDNKISAIRFTNKSEIERSVSFEADRDNYDIIIDNEPACLIGSPGILDKPEEIEVLLDIIENIDKKDPMIKYL